MKQLVFLVGSYYPNFSAVGYCVHQVILCLKNDFEVTVIAFRNDSSQPFEEVYEGVRILRIETVDMKRRNLLHSTSSRHGQLMLNWLRVRGMLRRLLSRETVDHALVQAYVDGLNALSSRQDIIIPVVFPFETVLAALRFKGSDDALKVVPYLFDDFVESGSLHVLRIAARIKRDRHLSLEHEMLTISNAVLSMHPLEEHFEKNFENRLAAKIIYLEHPLLKEPRAYSRATGDATLKLCFTGSLIRKVREPGYLLEMLSNVHLSIKVQVDFFVLGNAANQIHSQSLSNSIKIVNHGRVSKFEADAAVAGADILINIGESKGKQVSSKVFEYLSSGKPIVHFSYTDDDVVSKILHKYPLALTLIMRKSKFFENLRFFEKFIIQNKNKNIPFHSVRAIYPEALPENTSEHMKRIFNY